jgi:hypothetical protein
MKLVKLVVLVFVLTVLNADVIVLKDGEEAEVHILTARNDTLVVIETATGELGKFAFADIVRVERATAITVRDKSVEYGFFGGIIGTLVAYSLQELADLDDTKIITPLYTICVSSGIILGVQTGRP